MGRSYRNGAMLAVLTLLGMIAPSLDAAPSSASSPASAPVERVTLNEKSLPTSPGYHVFHGTAVADGKTIPVACGMFLPRAYFQPNDPMPVVVTLHNRGASGSDGGDVLAGEGLAFLVARNDPDTRGTGDMPANAMRLHDEAEFIALAPQCPLGYSWDSVPVPEIVSSLVRQITHRYRADPNRVYLTGFSYGASSTWKLALQFPDQFAAIAPLDGRAPPEPLVAAALLKNLPAYISVGDDDGEFIQESEKMRDALKTIGHANFIYHIVPHGNHWCYASVYTDPEFWTWLFAQHRPGSAAPRAMRPATRKVVVAKVKPSTQPARPAVLCQYFRDIPGTQVKDLTTDPAFPRFPNEQILLSEFELPVDESDDFASVLRATLRPTQSGAFTFYIAGQDQAELWLSSDEHPEQLREIAQVPTWSLPRDWTADPHQKSNPVQLVAGRAYFIEARVKHGVGDNHLSVAWRLPDGALEGPIPGTYLTPAAAVEVPAAKVVSIEPANLPTAPGKYGVMAKIDYLGRQQNVPVSLILPRERKTKGRRPALIYCPDGDVASTADGPLRELSAPGKLGDSCPLIVLAPQRPEGVSWENLWLQHATAAAIEALLQRLPIDPERVYLTGTAGGTTAVWALPALLPKRFALIVPFCPVLADERAVAKSLEGTKVHFVTGVEDGMATDRANRMNDALATIHPAPEVGYEMQMGPEVAGVYYARADFYRWLLGWRRPAGRAAMEVPLGQITEAENQRVRIGTIVSVTIAFVVVISGIAIKWLRRRTSGVMEKAA